MARSVTDAALLLNVICEPDARDAYSLPYDGADYLHGLDEGRSEEHTSELQSLMRISYAVFCLKKKINRNKLPIEQISTNEDCIHTTTYTINKKALHLLMLTTEKA